jgi:hypothetical protein
MGNKLHRRFQVSRAAMYPWIEGMSRSSALMEILYDLSLRRLAQVREGGLPAQAAVRNHTGRSIRVDNVQQI